MSLSETSTSNANIAQLLWLGSDRHPGQSCIVEKGREATYAQLQARTSSLARALRNHGVGRQDRVGILLERGINGAAALFACHALGAIAVVINERLRPRQIEHILRNSGAAVLLTSAELLAPQPRALESDARVVDISKIDDGASDLLPPETVHPMDFAQIIYTSGSTGLPKGVTFTHGQLRAGVDCVRGYLGLRADDRVASLLPFSAVYGVNQLLCTIAAGATLVVEKSPIPNEIVRSLRERQVTVLATVPPLWLQLIEGSDFSRSPMPSLRQMQNAGGHLNVSAVRCLRMAQPHAQLFLQYGMTETYRSSFLHPEEVDRYPDSIGRPVPGAEIFVLREDGTQCEVDETGELVFRGPTVAAGYWNDPEGTARTFRPMSAVPSIAGSGDECVVYSGDLARRGPDGLLYLVGRRDRMIKTLGFRVGPDEIADALFASGEVSEVVVTGEPDKQLGERIVAHLVLKPGGSLDAVRKHSRVELPRHMQPARYETYEALPRTAGGKYDVAALSARRTV